MGLLEMFANVLSAASARPGRALVVSNAATALFFLYLYARGHGGVKKVVVKALFKAVTSAPGARAWRAVRR